MATVDQALINFNLAWFFQMKEWGLITDQEPNYIFYCCM